MTAAVLTPRLSGPARRVGLPGSPAKWRKRILPAPGSIINYQDKTIRLSREYLASIVDAFRNRAYDLVPFQLATDTGGDSQDPERFQGAVEDLRLEDDGVWAVICPSRAGEALLRGNPSIGISARIVEGYSRADGKYFPAALQHIFGAPAGTATGVWNPAAELANGIDVVVDLSGSYYEDGEMDGDPELDELFDEAEEMGGGPFAALNLRACTRAARSWRRSRT